MSLSQGFKKQNRKGETNPIKALRSPGPQSDFSFSFMCKKTMLKMKSPAIMEKALA